MEAGALGANEGGEREITSREGSAAHAGSIGRERPPSLNTSNEKPAVPNISNAIWIASTVPFTKRKLLEWRTRSTSPHVASRQRIPLSFDPLALCIQWGVRACTRVPQSLQTYAPSGVGSKSRDLHTRHGLTLARSSCSGSTSNTCAILSPSAFVTIVMLSYCIYRKEMK